MNAQLPLNIINNDEAAQDIAGAIDAMINPEANNEESEPAAPSESLPKPKKERKAKESKPKEAKPAVSNNDKAKEKVREKPKAVILKGADGSEYELAADADPKEVQKEAASLRKSLGAIAKKDDSLLSHYLALGKFQSLVSKLFKSTKLYGQYLAKELPESQQLDAALRSNCKWLYEALNVIGAEGSDILSVLGVNRIEDYKSKNPTVIKRDYKAKAEELEKLKAAEELGVSVDELEQEEAAEAEAKAKEERENTEALISQFVAFVTDYHLNAKDPEDLDERRAQVKLSLRAVLDEFAFGKKKDAFDEMNSRIPVNPAE